MNININTSTNININTTPPALRNDNASHGLRGLIMCDIDNEGRPFGAQLLDSVASRSRLCLSLAQLEKLGARHVLIVIAPHIATHVQKIICDSTLHIACSLALITTDDQSSPQETCAEALRAAAEFVRGGAVLIHNVQNYFNDDALQTVLHACASHKRGAILFVQETSSNNLSDLGHLAHLDHLGISLCDTQLSSALLASAEHVADAHHDALRDEAEKVTMNTTCLSSPTQAVCRWYLARGILFAKHLPLSPSDPIPASDTPPGPTKPTPLASEK